ncbi:MAG: ATP-binding protein [Candidatus Dormibacteraeota bacterium]|nr:ATP-binding protein [Candidatus Dormibacteraeota bacterium]
MPSRVSQATNPFRFGRIVSGDAFTDRETDLMVLERELRDGQNVLIEAPRRFGKTSLILEVKRQLEAGGIPVAYLDCMLVPSRARLADRLASAYLQAFKSPAQRAEDWVVQHLRAFRVRPSLSFDDRGHTQLTFEAGSAGSPNLDALLEQLFSEPETIARERKGRLVVVLDEFQDLMELGPSLLRLLRAVIQQQQHVSYAFLGSRQALLRKAVHDRTAPLLKIARPYPLGPLPKREFGDFLTARLQASGRPIPRTAIDTLLDFTRGHPNDTQEAAHFLWEVALLPLSAEELVSTAIDRVLDAEAAQMTVLWHDSAPAQRNLLTALVEWGGRNIYSEAYRRHANLGPATTVQRAVQTLLERELVDLDAAGAYLIKERFFEEWIRRRIVRGEL